MKKITPVYYAIFVAIFFINCPTPKKADATEDILPLLLLTSASSGSSVSILSTFNNNGDTRNIPGATLSISGSGFSSNSADNIVTINGTAATVLTATTTTLTVTIPDLTSVTENQDVELIVKNGSKSATKTIKYYALPTLTVNVTNSFNRTFAASGTASSHWYKFTAAGSPNIINVSGYTSRDVDFYIYSSPTANSTTALATTSTTNAELLKTSALTSGQTYYIQVFLFSGSVTSYNIGIANQAVANASCSIHGTTSKCLDYLFGNSAAQADCGSGSWNATTSCSALALGTVVGRCTAPYATNIGTIYYYSNGGSAYSAGTAQTDCNGRSNSIFQ